MSYFEHFAEFNHDPSRSILSEFNRLAKSQGWTIKQRNIQRRICLQEEAELHWGDEDKLNSLQQFCCDLGVKTVPSSITQCTKVIKSFHVNIIDVIDAQRMGTAIRKFRTRDELKTYSLKHKKLFPRDWAKDYAVLRALLISVYD